MDVSHLSEMKLLIKTFLHQMNRRHKLLYLYIHSCWINIYIFSICGSDDSKNNRPKLNSLKVIVKDDFVLIRNQDTDIHRNMETTFRKWCNLKYEF